MQGLRRDSCLKKFLNCFPLALQLILVVLESLRWVVVLINLDVENLVTRVNPWCMDEHKLVSSLIDKVIVGADSMGRHMVAANSIDILFI